MTMTRRAAPLLLLLLMIVAVSTVVEAHSWVACTDYRIENERDSFYYNPLKCQGFPRSFSKFDRGFGADMGYNNQVPPSGKSSQACHPRAPMTQPLWDAYTDAYPMAKYAPGQNYCIAWPSKNHVAAECTDKFVPDGGTKLYISMANPKRDPTQQEFQNNQLHDFGANPFGQIAFEGFQHCPKFCENEDKSLCYGCFTVPENIQPGIYTIEWFWIFTKTLAYTSCFEVQVGDVGQRSSGNGPENSNSTVDVSKTPDTLTFKRTPVVVPGTEFAIDIEYNAAGTRVLVLELWTDKIEQIPLSSGSKAVTSGYSTTSVSVQPKTKINPADWQGIKLTLRAYMVEKADYDKNPWKASQFEMYRKEAIVTLGTRVAYSADDADAVDPASDAKPAIIGTGAAILCVAVVVASVLYYRRRRREKAAAEASSAPEYRLMSP